VICLGVMLICLVVRLTIKVSFALDKKHVLPQSPSPPPFISPSPSFSSPSPCTTGLALPHHLHLLVKEILLYPNPHSLDKKHTLFLNVYNNKMRFYVYQFCCFIFVYICIYFMILPSKKYNVFED